MGCSWNTNEPNCSDENSTNSSMATEIIPCRRISHPSFSLTDNEEENDNGEEKDYDSDFSSHRREAVQSKASKLMSRKRVFNRCKDGEKDNQVQPPQRIMLENILDSFDRLVDARIRAYARILSNHVRVLSESNNTKGATIAEYKLHTMLEVAANHLLFDSISTKFNALGHDDGLISTDYTSTKGKNQFSMPIELSVEIRSPRFFFEGLEAINCSDVPSSPQGGGKLIFRAKGKLRGSCFSVGHNFKKSNDTNVKDSCLTPETEVCRNSKNISCSTHSTSFFENAEIEIDCEALLSQMMEEASKVVTMAVELTNLAWTNNTEKQEEINNMNMIADENNKRTANFIVDDDDLSTSEERPPTRMTGKRPRNEDNRETQVGTSMYKQVSELSFQPPAQVVCNEVHVEEDSRISDVSPSKNTATITNLHLLDQDADRKTRYFHVSDPSYDSSSCPTDHDYLPEKCPHEDHQEAQCLELITAERACDIVDFVLAGDIIPCHFTPNKKLRTKYSTHLTQKFPKPTLQCECDT